MNYSWLYSRIFLFLSVYFAIYGSSVIGQWAFVPFYLMLTVYAFIMVLIITLIVILKDKMKEELGKRPKEGLVSSLLYGVGDVASLLLVGAIFSFNGFPEMMSVSYWFIALSVIGSIFGIVVNQWKGTALTKN